MEHSISDQDFQLFRDLIYAQSGIHFSSSNRSILESRLKERLKASQLGSVAQYHALIVKDPQEMKVLLDAVTTNLTRFFRSIGHFSALENHVFPDILAYKRKKMQNRLKLWSAGCSTGEEPFTLAMVLKERLPAGIPWEIIGSDLSLKSLMIAQEGFYPDSRVQDIPENYLNRYFDRKPDGYQIKEEIRKAVRFDYHNLKADSGLREIDILFCRNVLIYFDAEAQKAAINRFWQVMSNHSYLFIGHSESLFGMNTKFEFVKTDWSTFYRKSLDS